MTSKILQSRLLKEIPNPVQFLSKFTLLLMKIRSKLIDLSPMRFPCRHLYNQFQAFIPVSNKKFHQLTYRKIKIKIRLTFTPIKVNNNWFRKLRRNKKFNFQGPNTAIFRSTAGRSWAPWMVFIIYFIVNSISFRNCQIS